MGYELTYRLTKYAVSDLDEIVSYISNELSNSKAAADFIKRYEKAIHEIRTFPNSGALAGNEFLPVMHVRKKMIDNYMLYYTVDLQNNQIVILRIIYAKRELTDLIKKMAE